MKLYNVILVCCLLGPLVRAQDKAANYAAVNKGENPCVLSENNFNRIKLQKLFIFREITEYNDTKYYQSRNQSTLKDSIYSGQLITTKQAYDRLIGDTLLTIDWASQKVYIFYEKEVTYKRYKERSSIFQEAAVNSSSDTLQLMFVNTFYKRCTGGARYQEEEVETTQNYYVVVIPKTIMYINSHECYTTVGEGCDEDPR